MSVIFETVFNIGNPLKTLLIVVAMFAWLLIYAVVKNKLDEWGKKFPVLVYVGLLFILIGIIFILPTIPPEIKPAPKLPDSKNKNQKQSAELLTWWLSNNPELLSERGQLNSVKFLTVWSQHFPSGRVIYNHADGWALILDGRNGSFEKVETLDALITSGHGNSIIEENVLNDYLPNYTKDNKERVKTLIRERKLLGGIGTLFIRDHLYQKLGWPKYGEYLEQDVVFGKANNSYFVFIGLQNRPGDDETKCAIWFDKSDRDYTKQTNSNAN